MSAMEESHERRLDSLIAEYLSRVEAGKEPDRAEFLAQHPDFASELHSYFSNSKMVQGFTGDTGQLPRAFGDYELLEELGRGGMGVVFRARQKNLNRLVALKMILIGRLASAEDINRFQREAESVAALEHPNIVPIFEVGKHEGQPYFTMKLIEGGSLDNHLDNFKKDPRAAATLVAAVARAVRYAHQRGILHRDLKPANILLDEEMMPHLTDFGLAKRLDGGETQTTMGSVAGTLEYLAPERIASPNRLLSWSVDVYSMGGILYALLTGRPPFRGRTPLETLRLAQETEPANPRLLNSKVDRDLSTICLKCLEKDPGKRYEAAKPLADDLDNWLEGRPILARPVSRAERLWRWCRRKPLATALLGAAAIVLLLVAQGVAARSARRDEILESNVYIARHVASVMLGRMEEWGAKVEKAATDAELIRLLRDWNNAAEGFKGVSASVLLKNPEAKRLQEICERLPEDRAFETWHILDANGTMVARSPWGQVVGMNFKERDYFQGTLSHAGMKGRAGVHVSSTFRSVADDMYKFDICFPVGEGDRVLGVMNFSITTDATMGISHLHDVRRKAVLVAPWDPNRRPNDPVPTGPPPDYLLLLHPGYRKRGEDAVAIDSSKLPHFGGRRCGEELQAPVSAKASERSRDYVDPFAARDPAFGGRWLAGFAPVGNTGFVVIIQQRDE